MGERRPSFVGERPEEDEEEEEGGINGGAIIQSQVLPNSLHLAKTSGERAFSALSY